jgi:hypothetical protein
MIHNCETFKRYLSIFPDKGNPEAYVFTARTGSGKYAGYQDYHLVRPHTDENTRGSLMIRINYCPWCGKYLPRETPTQRKRREAYDRKLMRMMGYKC